MAATQTRIRSFPIERVHGELLAPRLRFEAIRKWASWGGFVVYLAVMIASFPRSFWMKDFGGAVSSRMTFAAVVLLGIPFLVLLVLTLMWQVSGESMLGRHGQPSLELVGDEISVEIDGSEKRRVSLVGASLSVGAWVSKGQVTGPLLVVAGRGQRLAIGVQAAALAREGEQGSPDVELDEGQYRELVTELGLS